MNKKQNPTDGGVSIRFIIVRRAAIISSAVAIFLLFVGFLFSAISAWRAQASSSVSCDFVSNQNSPFSYIQYNIRDQAIEPYFRGSFFIHLGDIPTGPPSVAVLTSAEGTYGNWNTVAALFRDESNKAFWMMKESSEVPFYRLSGSARDFPFDSTTIDFDTTFTPPLAFKFVKVRNLNPSFFIPCGTAKLTTYPSGQLHLNFEMRRNPLVKLMAIVILLVAALFVLIIPFAVKLETLPTAVASFFFSIWSIRGILNPEIPVFPSRLDLIVLCLCILLVPLIGIRLLIRWARR